MRSIRDDGPICIATSLRPFFKIVYCLAVVHQCELFIGRLSQFVCVCVLNTLCALSLLEEYLWCVYVCACGWVGLVYLSNGVCLLLRRPASASFTRSLTHSVNYFVDFAPRLLSIFLLC